MAACTTTDSKQLSAFTAMCHFLPSVNSRLLHVQLHIPVYSVAISSHCLSIKSRDTMLILFLPYRYFTTGLASCEYRLFIWFSCHS